MITIVIPTFSNSKGLELCLESVVKFTDLSKVNVLVVCNGASEETRTICKRYPVDYIWADEALGFTVAANVGIDHAMAGGADYVLLLNDDVILLDQPKHAWIDALLEPFADPRMGITGPLKQYCYNAEHDFLLFFCVLIRRQLIEEIGTLDEIFNPGAGEDTDYCIRTVRAGWKIQAVPDEEPTHAVKGDPTLPPHQQGMWITRFPLYHLAGETVANLPNWQGTFARNSEILRKRYGVSIERAQSIEGWMADSELAWLARQARTSAVVIEVGSWCGRSSRAIADNLPADAVLYCIDTFNGSSGEPDAHISAKEREGDGVYMKFFANLYDHIRLGRVVPVRMESGNAAEVLARMGVIADMLFIDGDHSTEGFRRDIQLWQPLVKDGGLLSGHDYYLPEQNPMAWIGVRTVVNEMFPDAEQAPDTSIWHVQKKDAREQFHAALDKQNVPWTGSYPVSQSVDEYGGFFGA